MADNWWDADETVSPSPAAKQDWWAKDETIEAAPRPSKPKRQPASEKVSQPTGEVHDGDTFKMRNGGNARLSGVDAFELNQQGRTRNGIVALGRDARDYLQANVSPGSIVQGTGAETYGRPVVTLETRGEDVSRGIIDTGYGLAAPEYLRGDPRLTEYMEAERLARLNRRGAHAGQFQSPADFRQGKPDPWAKPEAGEYGNSIAVFNDEPMPFQGLRPEIAAGYQGIWTDPKSTPDDLLAFAKANGIIIGEDATRKAYAERAKRGADPTLRYADPPKLLTNPGDGAVGAGVRGISDPVNMLDEIGGIVDTLGGTEGRESIWTSDRRFGDILYNNIDQNRSILAYDDAEHPYARFGGQLASGIIIPGSSLEGVGLAAARQVIREGGSRFAAEAAAKAAVRSRAGFVGAVEGGAAGFGAGEGGMVERLPGAGIGAVAGFALGRGTAALADTAGPLAGKVINRVRPRVSEADTVTPTSVIPELWGENDPVVREATAAMATEIDPAPSLSSERVVDRLDVNEAPGPAATPEQLSIAEGMAPGEFAPPVGKAARVEGDTPDFAGNIRLGNLQSPQDIRDALRVTDRAFGGFDAARRGVIKQAETEKLAGELGMSADDLLKRRNGEAFNAEQALAARQILAKSGDELVTMARDVQRLDDPGEEMLAAFRQAIVRHAAIQEQVSGATSEAGRALAQFRMMADGSKVQGNVLAAIVQGGGGATRLKDTASIILDHAGDPAGLNRVAKQAANPRLRDKLIELWYNSLLSGPQTHVVNMVGNTLTSLAQLPEHAMAAGIGAARQALPSADVDRVLLSEVGSRSFGLLQGAKEGLRQAARTMKTGETSDLVSKVESQSQSAISGIKGSIIRTPTRALAAEDEIFKAMARRMEIGGQAVRKAHLEGLKGEAARDRIAELMANPTDKMLDRASKYAQYLTFQNPLGSVGTKISQITMEVPILKLFLPFIRTPTNLLKFATERSPVAPFLKEWRADFKAGGASRDLAVARALAGTGVGMAVMEMASNGHVTGNGPADDGAKDILRADGWQPYSIRVGDKYYSYQRMDPFSTTIGVAADMVELQDYMTEKQKGKVATLITASVMQNLANKTWLSGLSDLIEAMSDPDRKAGPMLKRLAGSIAVPTGVAQVARTIDPTLREAEDILDAVRARIPGQSGKLQPRRDVWGKPITTEGGVGPDLISPLWQSTRKNDVVNNALLEAGAHIGKPQREVGGRKLTLKEYGDYQETAGSIGKAKLMELMDSGEWGSMDREERKDAASDVMRDARKQAKTMLFSELQSN